MNGETFDPISSQLLKVLSLAPSPVAGLLFFFGFFFGIFLLVWRTQNGGPIAIASVS